VVSELKHADRQDLFIICSFHAIHEGGDSINNRAGGHPRIIFTVPQGIAEPKISKFVIAQFIMNLM
jgi:hypothetical protein